MIHTENLFLEFFLASKVKGKWNDPFVSVPECFNVSWGVKQRAKKFFSYDSPPTTWVLWITSWRYKIQLLKNFKIKVALLVVLTLYAKIHDILQYVLEPSFRKPYQNANRWFTTMVNQPQVKSVIGEFKLCDKMAQFDNKKFAEVQSKLKQGGGDKKVSFLFCKYL